MTNEDTRIMQPQSSNSNNSANNASVNNNAARPRPATPYVKKESSAGKVAAGVAAGAIVGGAVGGIGTAAATDIIAAIDDELENQEIQAEDQAAVIADNQEPDYDPQPEHHYAQHQEAAQQGEAEDNPIDYTGNNGADPVTQNPGAHQASLNGGEQGGGQQGGGEENNVQVLGVYENTDENGVHQEYAVVTNGQEVAVVLDGDGDGEANVLWVDQNQNEQIDEGEVVDVSDQHVSMSSYEQAYVAQQQEMGGAEEEQQQNETFAYNAAEEADYNNDAEVYDA